ncbi:MAG: TolC family protein [Alistipes sp.]|nr:TolC family protein [Alistipes sp.]
MRRLLTIVFCLTGWCVAAQEPLVKEWTLRECLDYAEQNSIGVRQSRNVQLSGMEDTQQARAELFPSLVATTSHSYTNYPSSEVRDNDSYSGTYGLRAGLTLYEGGRLRKTLEQSRVQNRIDALDVEQTIVDLRIAIVRAYMQCLYAAEAVGINRSTAEVSLARCERAEQMWRAGSISRVDYAQLRSQYTDDEYQVVVAATSLDDYKLQLKQLLELDITEEMNPAAVRKVEEERIVSVLPAKHEVYRAALEFMPRVERGELAVESAELGRKIARAGFFPSVSLSASVGTGHMSGGNTGSGSQIWNRFNENVGLSIDIPIFSNRRNRTAVNKANIAVDNSLLERAAIEKEILKQVENAYLDASSAQARYLAASEKERYAAESFELTSEQFLLGAKNTVELLTAQNELTAARQEVLQAKYTALLNIELLNIYQGLEPSAIY